MYKCFIFFCLIMTEILFCLPVTAGRSENLLSVSDIKIPHQYGVVHDSSQADNKLIIHIQDNHTNYGAQKNLARILEYIKAQYDIDLVCVEGASGIIDTSDFSRFPDEKTKDTVSDHFLRNGKIDGSEYVSIVRNSGDQNRGLFSLRGIETPALYNANIISYKRAEQGHKNLKELISVVESRVETLKNEFYSNNLMRFELLVGKFLGNQDAFLDYCGKLARVADENLVDYGNLKNFSTLISLSSIEAEIDFHKADTERIKILDILVERLDSVQSENLFKRELRFKSHIEPPLKYHIYLNGLMRKNGIEPESYPEFSKFCRYLEMYGSLDNSLVMREEEKLRHKIYDALITSNKERQIYEISRYIILINHLSEITISQYEMKTLKSINHTMVLQKIASMMPDIEVNIPEAVVELNNYELFYTAAGQRETELVQNTFNLMEHNSKEVAVLIAGGYHSEGIKKILADNNVSYVVITPNAVHGEQSIPYFSLLSNYMTPLEQVMAPQVSSLKIASWLASESLADSVLKATLSQKMKLLFTSTLLNEYIQREVKKYPLSFRLALRDQIQSIVKSAINQALIIAQYDHLISVESINFIGNRIVAEIMVTDPQTKVKDTIFVDYSSDSDKSDIDSATQDTSLEVVKLIDGSVQSFINYKGYSQYVRQINGIQIAILEMLEDNSYSLEEILPELEYEISSLDLTSQNISALMNKMVEIGLIFQDSEGRYSQVNELVPRYICYLMVNSFKNNGAIQLRPKKLPSDMRLLTDYFYSKLNHISIDFSLELKDIEKALSGVIRCLYENDDETWTGSMILRSRLSGESNVNVLLGADNKELAVRIASTEPVRAKKTKVFPTAEQIRLEKEKKIWAAAGKGDTEAIGRLVALYHAFALDAAKSRHGLVRAKRARNISAGDIDQEGYLAFLQTVNQQRTEEEIDRIITEFGSFTEFVQEQVRIGIARFYADDTLKANLHYKGSMVIDFDATYEDSGQSKENVIMRYLDPLLEPEIFDYESRIEQENKEDAVFEQYQSVLDDILSNIITVLQRDMLLVYRNADTHREGINAVKEKFNVDTEYITNTINTLIKANEVFANFERMQSYLPLLEKKEQEVFVLFKDGKINAGQLADAMKIEEDEASLYLKNIVFKFHYFDLLARLRGNENYEFLRSFLLPEYSEKLSSKLSAENLKEIFDSLLFEDKFLLFSTYDQGLKPVALSNILPFAEVSIRQRMRIAIDSFNKAALLYQPGKDYKPFELADTVKNHVYNGTYPFTFKMTAPNSHNVSQITDFDSVSFEGINDYTFLLNLLPIGATRIPENEELKTFFEQLSPVSRKLVYLFFAKRMTYTEIQNIYPVHLSKITRNSIAVREQLQDFMEGEESSGYIPGLKEYTEKIVSLSDFSFIDELLVDIEHDSSVNEAVFRALSFSDQLMLYMRYYQKLPLRGWVNGIERQVTGRFQTLTVRINDAEEHLRRAINLFNSKYIDNPDAFSELLYKEIYEGIDQPPMIFKVDISDEEYSIDREKLKVEIDGISDFAFLLNALKGGLYRYPLTSDQQEFLNRIFNNELTYNERVILYLNLKYQLPKDKIAVITGFQKTFLFVAEKINRLVQQKRSGIDTPVSLFEQYRDNISRLSDFSFLNELVPASLKVDGEVLETVFRSMSFADQVILYMRLHLKLPNGGGQGVWNILFTSDKAEMPFHQEARKRFAAALSLYNKESDPKLFSSLLNRDIYTGEPVFPIIFRDDMHIDIDNVNMDDILQEIASIADFSFMLNSLEGGLYSFPLTDDFQATLRKMFFEEFTPEEQVQLYLRNKQGATLKSIRKVTSKILTTPYLQNKVTRLIQQHVQSKQSGAQTSAEYFTEQVSSITDFSALRNISKLDKTDTANEILGQAFKLLSYQDQVLLFMKHFENRPVSGGNGVFDLIKIASAGWNTETANSEARLLKIINIVDAGASLPLEDIAFNVNTQVYRGVEPFILLFKDQTVNPDLTASQKKTYKELLALEDYTFLLNLVEGGLYSFPIDERTQRILKEIFTKDLNLQDRKILYLRLVKQVPVHDIESLFHTTANLSRYISLFTSKVREKLYPDYESPSLMADYREKIAGLTSFSFMSSIPEFKDIPYSDKLYKRSFYALSFEDQILLFLRFHENMTFSGKGIEHILNTNDTRAKKYVAVASENAMQALNIAWEDESYDSADIAHVLNEIAYSGLKRFQLFFREDIGLSYSSKNDVLADIAELKDFTFLLTVIEPGVLLAPLSDLDNQTLLSFFRSLTEEEQLILYSRYKRNLSYDDIGAILSVSRSVAHKRVMRLSSELTDKLLENMSHMKQSFTQKEVNSLFKKFSFNISIMRSLMKRYLNGDISVMPQPEILNSNAVFSVLVSPSLTTSERYMQVYIFADKLKLSAAQFAKLQYIINESIPLPAEGEEVPVVDSADMDVVMLDVDDIGMRPNASKGNINLRKHLYQSVFNLRETYERNNKSVKFVIFSRRYNQGQITNMLGKSLVDELISNGGQVVDTESYSWFKSKTKTPYDEIIKSVIFNYDISSPQLKIASNNNLFIDQAGISGAVSVTGIRELSLALNLFSDLASGNVDDLNINLTQLDEYTRIHRFGEFTLSGTKISRDNIRMRQIRELIDSSL